jgi:endo-1,4-beta-mannosidase
MWIGANFWSRVGGPRMWSRYNAAVVREELAVLARHGCTVTRSFCFWPDFVPEVEQLDEDVLARFTDFLDAHVEAGLGTIPTVVVGHMSGQNWDPAWRQGRDLYRDAWLVSQQAWLAHELARRFGGHEAVVGWLLSNEMPLYGGPAATDDVVSWARALVEAIRSAGATQPISVGDGAWGVEVSGRDNGFSLRALAPLVDFLGPHCYPMLDDAVRQSLAAAFSCELAGGFGVPVVLEEFGVSSDFAADDHAADYYRQVLHTSLLAGAGGWLAWNNADYDDLYEEDPYRHHVFEMHFGLTDRAGRAKPQLHELAAFASLVRELSRSGWERVAGEAALVVPEGFERMLPFTDDAYRADVGADLLQAYVAAREADLPVGVVRERDGLPPSARLYLVPSAKLLTGPGLRRLQDLATDGATVYASYFAGSTPYQRGPWLTWLEEIFGIRHRLRYGLVDPIEDDEVVLELVEELGGLDPGTLLRFPVAGEPSARSYLPLEPAGARVVAVDGRGRPALLRHDLGAGQTVFCAYPLEHMAARTPHVNPEDTWKLYAALAELAGVARPVRVDDPRVLVGCLRGRETDTVLLVNSSSDTVQAEPVVAGGDALVPAGTLTIGPYGVAVARRSITPTIRSAPEDVAAVAASERRDAQH